MATEILVVNGVTNEGKFVHANLSISGGTEAWNPWKEVNATAGAQNPGPFSSIDSVDAGIFMHICGITADGRLLHTLLNMDATVWDTFDSPPTIVGGDLGQLQQVRIDLGADGLHLCVLAHSPHGQPRILHTVRHDNGTWDAFQDITQDTLAGSPGSFVSIDCAASTDGTQKLHVCGVTADGKLWHTALSNQNVWSHFAAVKSDLPKDTGHSTDVEMDSSNNSGHFRDVRMASSADKLHVCALRSGVLWHTILFSNPVKWQPTFDNVNVEASNPGTILSFACAAGPDKLHVPVVTSDGKLWHTIFFEELAGWVPFENVTTIIGDLSIFLKFFSLISVVFELTLLVNCPSDIRLRMDNLCLAIHRRTPNIASARAGLQALHNQHPQCSMNC